MIRNPGEIMKTENSFGLLIMGLCLAIGLSLCGFFISQTIYNAKVALNTAEAKGLAERRVKADRANWNIHYKVVGLTRAEVPGLYKKAEQDQNTIIKVLTENGFEENEIEDGGINYKYREFRDEDQKLVDQRHSLIGTISVETNKVQKVREVRTKVNQLIAKGIDLDNRTPTYLFTKLNEIKPEMLREATKNARIAANEFAENANVKVGGIRSARQGNFYIKDAGMDYGDTKKIEKDVRVVTNITFFLIE